VVDGKVSSWGGLLVILCDFKSRMKGLGSTINGLEGEIHQGF
jgi:hypothetical protein